MPNPEQRIMKLGQTDGFRYIGFKPPLTREELDNMPLPVTTFGVRHEWNPPSVQLFGDDTMGVGFDSTPFDAGELFTEYAQRLAEHLGNCSLYTQVRIIGPGGVIAQANGATPDW